MALPVFPANLPGVKTFKYRPASDLLSDENEGDPRQFRLRSTDLIGVATVSWQFLEEDYDAFLSFWREDLLNGHRWFLLDLPSERGIVPHVVTFIGRYQHKHNGYRAYEVSAKLSVRGRRPAFIYLTSEPYPVVVVESMNAAAVLLSSRFLFWPIDNLDVGMASLMSGELRAVLRQYQNWPAEPIDVGAELISGTLRNGLVTYANWPFEPMDVGAVSLVSGSFRVALISYTHWPAEAMDVGSVSLVSGTLV